MPECLDPACFALVVEDLHKTYVAGVSGCRATVRALQGATLLVAAGETVALLGGPGAGKTTLLLCSAGLLRPDCGRVLVDGQPLARPADGVVRYVAYRDARSVALARATAAACTSRLLLLDGVLDVMDACARRELLSMLASRASDGCATVIATESATIARQLHVRVQEIADGRLPRRDDGAALAARVAEGWAGAGARTPR
jgi:ABC-type multidrug transport system ATPase subunit